MGLFGTLVKKLEKKLKDKPAKAVNEEDAVPFYPKPINLKSGGAIYDLIGNGPPPPANDDERMHFLEAIKVFSMGNDKYLDDLLANMCRIFNAPHGSITLFGNMSGFLSHSHGEGGQLGQVGWTLTTCPWTTLLPEPTLLVCNELSQDARFSHTLWVELGLRAYICCPLVASNKHRIGSICFLDTKPREFTSQDCKLMTNLAELAIREIERHLDIRARIPQENCLQDAYSRVERSFDSAVVPVAMVDVSQDDWTVTYGNYSWKGLVGRTNEAPMTKLADIFEANGRAHNFWRSIESMKDTGRAFRVEGVVLKRTAAWVHGTEDQLYNLNFRPAAKDDLDDATITVTIPSYVPTKGPQKYNYYFVTAYPVKTASTLEAHAKPAVDSTHMNLHVSDNDGEAVGIPGLTMSQLLGTGAHGAVYFGNYQGNDVAVKILGPFPSTDDEAIAVVHEVKVSLGLNHPNLVKTFTYNVSKTVIEQEDEIDLSCTSMSFVASVGGSTASRTLSCASDIVSQSNSVVTSGVAMLSMNDAHMCMLSDEAEAIASNGSAVHNSTSSTGLAASTCTITTCATLNSKSEHVIHSASSIDALCLQSSKSINNNTSVVINSGDDKMLKHQNSVLEEVKCKEMITVSIVMEHCNKGCLQDAADQGWLRADRSIKGTPNFPAILITAKEIASGMAYLHSRDTVHGDLSGFNILLSSNSPDAHIGGRGFVAKVSDFGYAREMNLTDQLRINSYGTITHMPPELLEGNVMSKAADVYSFGVLLWNMYTSARPWAGMRHMQIMHAVLHDRLSLKIPADMPPKMAALIRSCLAYDRFDRPTFAEIVQALDAMGETMLSSADQFVGEW